MTKEQVGNVINGVYLLHKENNASLLQKVIEDCGFQRVVRAYLGYSIIPFDSILVVLQLTGKFFHTYYGTIPVGDEGDEMWEALMEDANNLRAGILHEHTGMESYVTEILQSLIEIIEDEYKNRQE